MQSALNSYLFQSNKPTVLAKTALLVQDLACRPDQICTFFPSTNYFPVLASRLTSNLTSLLLRKPFWGSRNKNCPKSGQGVTARSSPHVCPLQSLCKLLLSQHNILARQKKQTVAPRQGSCHQLMFSQQALAHVIIFKVCFLLYCLRLVLPMGTINPILNLTEMPWGLV